MRNEYEPMNPQEKKPAVSAVQVSETVANAFVGAVTTYTHSLVNYEPSNWSGIKEQAERAAGSGDHDGAKELYKKLDTEWENLEKARALIVRDVTTLDHKRIGAGLEHLSKELKVSLPKKDQKRLTGKLETDQIDGLQTLVAHIVDSPITEKEIVSAAFKGEAPAELLTGLSIIPAVTALRAAKGVEAAITSAAMEPIELNGGQIPAVLSRVGDVIKRMQLTRADKTLLLHKAKDFLFDQVNGEPDFSTFYKRALAYICLDEANDSYDPRIGFIAQQALEKLVASSGKDMQEVADRYYSGQKLWIDITNSPRLIPIPGPNVEIKEKKSWSPKFTGDLKKPFDWRPIEKPLFQLAFQDKGKPFHQQVGSILPGVGQYASGLGGFPEPASTTTHGLLTGLTRATAQNFSAELDSEIAPIPRWVIQHAMSDEQLTDTVHRAFAVLSLDSSANQKLTAVRELPGKYTQAKDTLIAMTGMNLADDFWHSLNETGINPALAHQNAHSLGKTLAEMQALRAGPFAEVARVMFSNISDQMTHMKSDGRDPHRRAVIDMGQLTLYRSLIDRLKAVLPTGVDPSIPLTDAKFLRVLTAATRESVPLRHMRNPVGSAILSQDNLPFVTHSHFLEEIVQPILAHWYDHQVQTGDQLFDFNDLDKIIQFINNTYPIGFYLPNSIQTQHQTARFPITSAEPIDARLEIELQRGRVFLDQPFMNRIPLNNSGKTLHLPSLGGNVLANLIGPGIIKTLSNSEYTLNFASIAERSASQMARAGSHENNMAHDLQAIDMTEKSRIRHATAQELREQGRQNTAYGLKLIGQLESAWNLQQMDIQDEKGVLILPTRDGVGNIYELIATMCAPDKPDLTDSTLYEVADILTEALHPRASELTIRNAYDEIDRLRTFHS